MPQLVVTWIASAIMTAFPTLVGGLATATAIAQFGVGLLISAIRGAIAKDQQPGIKRELAQVTERPAYRYVYGYDRAVGTPAPRRVVKDNIIGCWILNSRPSFLPGATTRVFLDDRDIEWTGNPFDFDNLNGGQATKHVAGLVKFWIGRGDQVKPPQEILNRFNETVHPNYGFKGSDRWRGLTVLWAIFDAGDDDDFQEKWPSNSPGVAVEGQWSLVWNANDPAQYPNRPDTWKWDDNAVWCTLDALRNNPVAPYTEDLLIVDDFKAAAPKAAQAVLKQDGTSERRYVVGGTLKWTADKEIEDQIQPLLLAGAASLVRVGGRLGYRLGVWEAPTRTITDIVGDDLEFVPYQTAEELPTEIRVNYMSAARGYEPADLAPIIVPGAKARNGGMDKVRSVALTMVTSATQAMRIKRILWREAQRARTVTVSYPAQGFALSVGEWHTLRLPAPLGAMLNGTYQVVETSSLLAESANGEGSFLTTKVTIHEGGAHIYEDWTTDMEEEVIVPPFDGNTRANRPGQPVSIGYEVGSQWNVNSGGTVVSRARIWFVPDRLNGSAFEPQVRVGTEDWEDLPRINNPMPDAQGRLHYFINLEPGRTHSTRVRATKHFVYSSWPGPYQTLTGIITGFAITGLSVSAPAGTPGRLNVSGTAPGIAYATRVRLYRNAFAIPGLRTVDPGEAFSITWDGLAAGSADFYVAPVSTTGVEGSKSGPFTRTIA